MKKIIFLWAALLMTAVSCEKNIPETEVCGIPMTLTATIGSDETRISYTDDEANKVIKALWRSGDKVSVVSIGSDNAVIANDIFTTTGSGESADFNGTFTGGDAAVRVMVYYPAMTESYIESSVTKWGAPSFNDGYNRVGVIHGISVGDKFIWRSCNNMLQRTADSPAHLENLMVLAGTGNLSDIKNNSLKVTLAHNMYVFKVNMTFPSEGETVRHVELIRTSSTGSYGKDQTIDWSGWGYIYAGGGRSLGGYGHKVMMNLGEKITSYEMGSGVTVPSGRKLTVYMPASPSSNGSIGITAGDQFTIECTTSANNKYSKTLTVTSNRSFSMGNVYPVDVTF